jgi:Zn-dependent metalloprotease
LGGLLLFISSLMFTAASQAQTPASRTDLSVHVSPITGYATFVSPKPERKAFTPQSKSATDPLSILAQYGHLMGVTAPDIELSEVSREMDEVGHLHTTYAQTFNGVPVFSGVVKVHQSGSALVALNGNFYPIPLAITTAATVASETAAMIALMSISSIAPVVEESQLVIVDPGWYGNVSVGPRLAYYFVVADPNEPLRQGVFVDAHNANVLDRWNLLENGRNRQIHDARSIFGNLPGPIARFEGGGPTGIADVDNAFDYAGDTYGYYLRAFGRDSIDGRGAVMRATVRALYSCPNAFFNDRGFGLGPQTVFCAGLASDDVVAHEFTHGVTRFSANLIYQNQSGQLNESFSDVFGELVDLFNGNAGFAGPPDGPPFWPVPVPYVGPGTYVGNQKRPDLPLNRCSNPPAHADGVRWLVGEDTILGELRDMWNPTCFRNPERTTSAFYSCGPGDNGSVHSGSGVPNHAFAIVTDGKNFNGQNVVGIGPIKSGAVWYRALTRYLTPASNFQDAYFALNQSAADLVNVQLNDPRTGLPGPVFTAADALEVDSALRAVEMNVAVPCGGAARSFIFIVDTTGSAAGANTFL